MAHGGALCPSSAERSGSPLGTQRLKTRLPPPPPRKRRRLTVFAIFILGLVLLVGLLPTIIAYTPLMAYLIRRAAMLDGTITFRSASDRLVLPGIDFRHRDSRRPGRNGPGGRQPYVRPHALEAAPQLLERRHATNREAAAQRQAEPRRQQRGIGARPLADRTRQFVEPGR